jgi:hypothetical protein
MKKLLFVAVLFTALFASCKKESCPAPVAPTYPVEGAWYGKYGGTSGTLNSGFSMVVEVGGTVLVVNGASVSAAPPSSRATGTWTLTGNVFKVTYTYPGGAPLYLIANFSNVGKLESGTWGSLPTATDGGLWFMDRKN